MKACDCHPVLTDDGLMHHQDCVSNKPASLTERLELARAKARKKAHRDAIADRKAVAEANRKARKKAE